MKARTLGIVIFLCVCLIGAPGLTQNKRVDYPDGQEETGLHYGYYYKGKLVTLNLSTQLIAVEEKGASLDTFVQNNNLKPHSLSNHPALTKHGMRLYRLPADTNKTAGSPDVSRQIRTWNQTSGQVVQPVFEQGTALLIPSDEVILGFKEYSTLDEARRYVSPYMDSWGIIDLRTHRKNTFILRINNPADGRVYEVCQFLSQFDEIQFAEPNHIVVMRYKSDTKAWPNPAADLNFDKYPDPSSAQLRSVTLPSQDFSILAPVGWTTLIDESFEGTGLPSGWSTGRYGDAVEASWRMTNYRSHSGNRSIYATGGWTDGILPPGPYPNNAYSWLDTPPLNLAAYEEVYIEFWFYAKYEDPLSIDYWFDYGRVQIYDTNTDTITILFPQLVTSYTGDLTSDPTTDNGWRRALFRVPPSLRINGVMVEFIFYSDGSINREGLYIDQVRVVATTDVDSEPLGNDTYSGRQYELNNAGQIAGLGGEENDLHLPEAWDLVSVSPDVVVAVIDNGVDLAHADLNLVTGYDYDGSEGGGPKDANHNHGTNVAGNIGAIGNNSLGVVGTAPGVKIMPIYIGETWADRANAIDVAVDNGADILNNSWGQVDAQFTDVENAIRDALAAGCIVIFAAGNGPDRSPWSYQTAFPCELTASTDLICVGATSPTDEHKGAASSDGQFGWGSSYVGNGPDVCAPGPWSYTTDRTGTAGENDGSAIDPDDPVSADYWHDFGGTSSAAPKVAGIAALLLSANPSLTPADVKRILRDTADDIDLFGADEKTGAGRVNAYQALLGNAGPTVVTHPASSIASTTATLNGTVNPNGLDTEYYFEYGTTTAYGSTTSVADAGSGTSAISVMAAISGLVPETTYYFRIVATNSSVTSYGADASFDTLSATSAYDLNVNIVGSGTVTLDPPGGTYAPGTVVTLTAAGDPGWGFGGWSGDLSGTANPATITMNSDRNITATFVQGQFRLNISTVGQGTVTLSPPGGIYEPAEHVTLKATADTLWEFSHWSGDLTGSDNPDTVTMDADKHITATFAAESTPDADYLWEGFEGEFVDAPNYGSIPAEWMAEGPDAVVDFSKGSEAHHGTSSLHARVTYHPTHYSSLVRTFSVEPGADTLNLHLKIRGATDGQASAGLATGTRWTFRLWYRTTPSHWHTLTLQNVSVPSNGQLPVTILVGHDQGGGYTDFDIDCLSSNAPLEGQEPSRYTLTVNAIGQGNVTLDPPGGIYEPGTVVALTAAGATPDCMFCGWGGALDGVDNPATVTMNSNKIITASFIEVVSGDPGSTIMNMTAVDPDDIPDISGKPAEFPYGMMEMEIEVASAGETAVIAVTLPNSAPAGYKWYKYTAADGWLEFGRDVISGGTGDGAEFNPGRTQVTIYVTDNGPYDDDPTVRNVIDPSGLALMAASSSSSGSGGGGGGCFIDAAAFGFSGQGKLKLRPEFGGCCRAGPRR
jgi:hypothetical protein